MKAKSENYFWLSFALSRNQQQKIVVLLDAFVAQHAREA
jgi:hypothetical protein